MAESNGAGRATLFTGQVVLADRLLREGAVLVRGERIVAIGAVGDIKADGDVDVVDAGDGYVAPGFVDIHVHGARGADFMDGTAEAVELAIQGHTAHGTTTICPTTTTGRPDQLTAMLDACRVVREAWRPGRHAHLPGVHWYGPYFASEKIGAHPRGYERTPDPAEYEAAFATGLVKVATCAAELPGAEAFYRAAKRAGCLATCGHSNASFTEMQKAFDAGMSHVDHFWCAMSNVSSVRKRLGEPMQASMTEFVLATQGMTTEVIADGEHLAPDLLEVTYRLLGAERLCLVTDANRAVDMPHGQYKIGPLETGETIVHDGKVGRGLADGGLASSVVGMDFMVRHFVNHTSADVVHGVRMASLTPARLIGLADEVGSLAVGKRADVQVLDADLRTQRVWVAGRAWVDAGRG